MGINICDKRRNGLALNGIISTPRELAVLERAKRRIQERRERRGDSLLTPTSPEAVVVSPRSIMRASSPSLITDDAQVSESPSKQSKQAAPSLRHFIYN